MADMRLLRRVSLWGLIFLILLLGKAYAGQKPALISPGMTLPKFTLPQCESKEDKEYLGLKGTGAFKPSDASGKLVLIEILSVF